MHQILVSDKDYLSHARIKNSNNRKEIKARNAALKQVVELVILVSRQN